MTLYALAADMGGTRTRVALVERDGNIQSRHAADTLADRGRDDVMNRFVEALETVASTVDKDSIIGLGISMASPTDPATGEMYNPPNLPGDEWHRYSPIALLEERLGIPAFINNDATLGALGEHEYGAGKGYSHMIYMTLSTGIGGGIIIDGNLYTGNRGFAAEIGHMTIDRNGPLDNCGNVGCLESLASGTAIARMARERLAAGETSALSAISEGDMSKIDARMVAETAKSGDSLAKAIMDEVSTNLGIGIVSLMHIFDPDAIVVGGGMTQNLDMLLPGIEAEIKTHAMAHLKDRMPIVKSQLGDDVSLLGAAAQAFRAHDRRMATGT